MINVEKLDKELRAAGLPVLGVSSDGRIDWPVGHPTSTEQSTANSVLAAHDPNTPTPLEQQLINLAQSTVGVRVDELTANQTRALLALLLRRAGAVDAGLAVRPLRDWFVAED